MTSHPRHGFTLIEVVISISMTAFIGLALGISLSTTVNAKDTVEQGAERYRMLRVAMSRMAHEIEAAFVSDRYDSKRYRDAYDRPTNFIGAHDRLTFTSLAHQRLYSDAKESDQMVIEYSLKTSSERNARGRTDLIRREKVLLEERMERGGTEDSLYEGAKKLEFQYWNSDRKQWDDDWDTRRLDKKSILPTRVKVTLTAIDEGGKEVHYTTQMRVMLNTEFARFE